jgi:hypothetical protein
VDQNIANTNRRNDTRNIAPNFNILVPYWSLDSRLSEPVRTSVVYACFKDYSRCIFQPRVHRSNNLYQYCGRSLKFMAKVTQEILRGIKSKPCRHKESIAKNIKPCVLLGKVNYN